jgi:hypothetical protein
LGGKKEEINGWKGKKMESTVGRKKGINDYRERKKKELSLADNREFCLTMKFLV